MASKEDIKRLKAIALFLDDAELKIEGKAVATVAALLSWFRKEYIAELEKPKPMGEPVKEPVKKIGADS